MEAYKEVYRRVNDNIKSMEIDFMELSNKKDKCYQQYDGLVRSLIIQEKRLNELKEEKQELEDKKINWLRRIELISMVALFVLILGIGGNWVLPILTVLLGSTLGSAVTISGTLIISVLSVLSVLKLDRVLSVKIINKLKRRKDYQELDVNCENAMKRIALTTEEKDKKLNEYDKLKNDIEKLIENKNEKEQLSRYLKTLIEEDEEMTKMEKNNNFFVRKRTIN